VVDLNLHMQEYKTTGQQQAEPTPVTAPRFDPRRIYTILVLAPLVYAVIRYLPPLAFSGVVCWRGDLPSSNSTEYVSVAGTSSG
jgi:hypothetical protein